MANSTIEKIALASGYTTAIELMIKVIMPIIFVSLFVGWSVILFVKALPWYVGIIIIGLGSVIAVMWPIIQYEKRRKDIEKRLYFFITYAGTVSTMKISVPQLFTRFADKREFGSIGEIFQKILYLSKSWNLGYAKACRSIAESCPSQIMADFLDRLAVAVEMGQDVGTFMIDEQTSVINDFATEYNKQLESLKSMQEVFIAFSVSGALVMGVLLLGPLLTEMDMDTTIVQALLGFGIMDTIMIGLMVSISIHDPIYSELRYESEKQKMLRYIMFGCFGLGFIIFVILWNFTKIPFLFVLAISLLPMIIPSVMYKNQEEFLTKCDYSFPVYIRAIGGSINIRRGAVARALQSTQVHDFNVLNDHSIRLYKRLKLGNDKFKCWHLFGSEIGSYLIYNFSKIFSQSIYLGGNADQIGRIVSTNIQKVLTLRKMKYHAKDGILYSFYGVLVGLGSTMFVSVKISEVMVNIFRSQTSLSSEMNSFMSAIIPSTEFNFDFVFLIISLLLLLHILTMCIMLKIIHGTEFTSYYTHMVIMIWIIAFLSWSMPIMVDTLLPDLTLTAAPDDYS